MAFETLEERRLLAIVPAGLLPGAPYHLAFATSATTPWNFGGITGGDAFVNSVVATTNSPVTTGATYQAILSDSLTNAKDRITSTAPVYNTLGQLVANSYQDLWNTSVTPLINPIAYDEAGKTPFAEVFTGTRPNGAYSGLAAGNWAAPINANVQATVGIAGPTGPGWLDTTVVGPGGLQLALYGISVGLTVPGEPSDLGSIHGTKFDDLDGDGVRDPGEPGLDGWTIELLNLATGQVAATTTTMSMDVDHNGRIDSATELGLYWFEGLDPGEYQIREVLQDGWVQTTPDPAPVFVDHGATVEGVDFGNFELIEICGVKFDDLNGDGVQDPDEPGIAGWTIFLDSNNNGVLDANEQSAVTDDKGEYCFRDLGPGTYVVRELQQAGWVATLGGAGYTITAVSGVDPNSGQCGSAHPKFNASAYASFTGQVAVATCFGETGGDAVLAIVDISGNPPVNTNYLASIYHDAAWNKSAMGDVFGVTIDDLGNIYVTATSAFPADWATGQFPSDTFGPGGAGAVYKISRYSGTVSVFATLPNPSRSALGNIAFDSASNSFFVSNFEDGKIYQLDASGATIGVFDHGIADPGDAQVAALGERVWAVEVHNGTLYYSVWVEDRARIDNARANEIWSIDVSSGTFAGAATKRLDVPALPQLTYSNPVSDISFGPTGKMLLNERSMQSDSTSWAHDARQLEFELAAGVWVSSGVAFNIGSLGQQMNSAGGGDYDYTVGGRVWSTGDALRYSAPEGHIPIYGLQGTPSAGGNYQNSVLIDLDANVVNVDKTEIGDVEIPCPVGVNFGNRRSDDHDVGSVHGEKFEDLNGNGVRDPGEQGLAGWQFYADLNDNGVHDPGEPIATSMADDPNTTEDETGMYWLEGVPAGTWNIREILPPGWAQTTPLGPYTVTIGLHQVNYSFTTDDDFDQGTLSQLNHDAPHSDQLQIDKTLGAAEPIIWISNSREGTISKFDTQTGKELARYRTGSEYYAPDQLQPSRVAVNGAGDVWVANRGAAGSDFYPAVAPPQTPNAPVGNVIKVLHSGFIDRNGNGVMDTSKDTNNNGTIDPGEILPWDANNDGQPDDERIALVIHAGRDNSNNPVLFNGGARGMAIDAQDRLWVGLRNLSQYEVFDANTGAYITQVAVNNAPYGAVIDKSGTLWNAAYPSFSVDRIDTNSLTTLPSVNFGNSIYGITVDTHGVVWASTWNAGPIIKRYDPVTATLSSFTHPAVPNFFGGSISGGALGGGITVDRNEAVWAASLGADKMLKYVFDSSGSLIVAQSVAVAVGADPKAATIDSDGFAWTTSLVANQAYKIDTTANVVVQTSNTGLHPYNYSDMTGDVRAASTTPQGSWTVVRDSHVNGMAWNNINWNNEPEASLPAGTSVVVEVRAHDTQALLAAQPWTVAVNNANPGVVG
ncbi:MAG: hypothetical protein KDA61_16030, partial [Planctomycetales bacterium]|nr:hypothetical protein [Planctomycetales bacterium]